jgi:hypothetical protein
MGWRSASAVPIALVPRDFVPAHAFDEAGFLHFARERIAAVRAHDHAARIGHDGEETARGDFLLDGVDDGSRRRACRPRRLFAACGPTVKVHRPSSTVSRWGLRILA